MIPQKAEAFLKSLYMRPELLAERMEDWKRFLRYFPSGYSEDFKNYAARVFSKHSSFLICYDRTDRQKAFCTSCGRKVVLPKEYSHNFEAVPCPYCETEGVIKHNWRFKTPIITYGYVMQYDKADYDKKAVVCRAVNVLRAVYPDVPKVEWCYHTRQYYLFKAGRLEHREHIGPCCGYFIDELIKHKTMYNMLARSLCLHGVTAENIESLAQAAHGTKWQYALPLEMAKLGLLEGDGVRLLELYEKYPQIEYFIKAGFGDVVLERLQGNRTTDIINWRAKTMKKAIKINLCKPDYKFIREQPKAPAYEKLLMYKLMKAENPGKLLRDWQVPELFEVLWITRKNELTQIHGKIGSVAKICEYVKRQQERKNPKEPLYLPAYIVLDWNDYLHECETLGLNMRDTAVLMPDNLERAHRNTTKQIKIKADELLNKQIAARQKSRQSFNFASGNLLCRPAANSDELVAEGAALNHCVGSYAKKYAKAETHIIFIRRADAPDVPFYTMEVSTGFDVVQVRGLRNCGVTPEVDDFVKHFKAEVLRKLKRKARNAA